METHRSELYLLGLDMAYSGLNIYHVRLNKSYVGLISYMYV